MANYYSFCHFVFGIFLIFTCHLVYFAGVAKGQGTECESLDTLNGLVVHTIKLNQDGTHTQIKKLDCWNGTRNTFKITPARGRTIQEVGIGMQPYTIYDFKYGYSKDVYTANVGLIYNVDSYIFSPPIYLKYLVLTAERETSKTYPCIKFILKACKENRRPQITISQNDGKRFILVNTLNLSATIKGQPRPYVQWETTAGYSFPASTFSTQYGPNLIGSSHRSTFILKRGKNLAEIEKGGFKCDYQTLECLADVVCRSWYPGAMINATSAVKGLTVILRRGSPPQNPSVINVNDTSAVVKWTIPTESGDSDVTYFKLNVKSNSATVSSFTVNITSPKQDYSYFLKSLKVCTTYTIDVMSGNLLGDSKPNSTTFSTFGRVYGVRTTAQTKSSTSIRVEWTIVKSNGNCNYLYNPIVQVKYHCHSPIPQCSDKWTSYRTNITDLNTTSVELANLHPGTKYEVKAWVFVPQLKETFSSAVSQAMTDDAKPSGFPMNATATAVNFTAISVTWDRIRMEERNGKIINYILSVTNDESGKALKTINITRPSQSVIIGNLEVCTYYTFKLSGCTRTGCGPSKDIRQVTKDYPIPAALTVQVQNKKAPPMKPLVDLTLSWKYSYKCIQTFSVEYKPELSKENWTSLPSQSAKQQTTQIQTLLPYVKYTIRARLDGYSSSGDWKEASIRTLEGIPSGVIGLRVADFGLHYVDIEWEPPKYPRGIIVNYEISYLGTRDYDPNFKHSKTFNVSGDINLYNVSELYPASSYTFHVKVYNTKFPAFSLQKIQISTNEKALAIDKLTVGTITETSVTLRWTAPTGAGLIIAYEIDFNGIRDYDTTFKYQRRLNVSAAQANYTITKLPPATTYKFQVRAWKSDFPGAFSKVAEAETYAQPPMKPNKPLVEEKTIIQSQIKIYLQSVPSLTGPITSYQIIVLERNKNFHTIPANFNSSLYNFTLAKQKGLSYYLVAQFPTFRGQISFTVGDSSARFGLNNPQLDRNANYTFYFRAVTRWKRTLFGEMSSVDIDRFPITTIPIQPNNSIATSDSFTIKLIPLNPRARFLRVIVIKLKEDSNGNPIPYAMKPEDIQDSKLTSYSGAGNAETEGIAYITAELSKAYLNKFKTFVVGDGEKTNRYLTSRQRRSVQPEVPSYYNGPLKYSSYYTVFFRSYLSDVVYFSSPWLAPIKTAPPPPFPSGSLAGLIVGIILCCLLLILIYFIGRFLWQRHKLFLDLAEKAEKLRKGTLATGQDNPAYEAVEFKFENARKGAFFLTYPIDQAHPPINVAEFPDHVVKFKADHLFREEFQHLETGTGFSKDSGNEMRNESKNRYLDVIPYDHSRVVLKFTKKKSDYINASYVDSYMKPQAYIATQAPMQAHLDDFWHMIWQEDVRTIIMLVNIIEGDKVKTAHYWPSRDTSEIQRYGDVEVRAEDEHIERYYTTRSFTVYEKFEEEREVRQFHFTAWPDRGVPETAQALLRFRETVRRWQTDKPGPMIVHCSAGVGRTGTYMAIDAILEQISLSRTVDIFNYVNYMRTRRVDMIQTPTQYQYVHEAVVEGLISIHFDVEMNEKNAPKVMQALDSIDSITGYTGFRKLFRQLNHLTPTITTMQNMVGWRAENDYKNRFQNVPLDDYRVKLPTADGARDYINASYVNCENKEKAFITTQAPFGVTMRDFWLAVYDNDVEVIVTLNEQHESDLSFTEFWPSADILTAEYGEFKVSLELESTPVPGVIKREFTIAEESQPDDTYDVIQYHLLAWPDHDVPSTSTVIIQLFDSIFKDHMSPKQPPILVQCSDGLGRSGTFCACMNSLNALKEGSVDVTKILKGLRIRHPGYVETEAQFRFVFQVVRDYYHKLTAGRKAAQSKFTKRLSNFGSIIAKKFDSSRFSQLND